MGSGPEPHENGETFVTLFTFSPEIPAFSLTSLILSLSVTFFISADTVILTRFILLVKYLKPFGPTFPVLTQQILS